MKSALILIALALLPLTASAQGVLIPEPPGRIGPEHERPEWQRIRTGLSIESHRVKTKIDNQMCTTTVEQVFKNDVSVDLQGTYIFPIPEGASVTQFAMWVNGDKVSGELLEAAEARRIYEDIVRRLKDPGLLEYIGRDMFRARVYPIPGRGTVEIELVYHELLKYDSGLIGYCYPVVPANHRRRALGDFSIDVAIASNVAIKSLYSPTHDIDRRINGRKARCSFEESNVTGGSDFVLYYGLSEEDIGLNLVTHRRSRGDGYFALLLSPGHIDRPDKILRKDVMFVIDRSGSMKGDKIQQAKDALSFCLESLKPQDRFNIITFAGAIDRFDDRWVRKTEDRLEDALDFVDDIRAGGGTDINQALLAALEMEGSSRPQHLIFLTDGEPTVGETHIYKIVSNITDKNDDRLRLFVFGVGYSVNTQLLDKLSTDNRGTVEYVTPDENIEVKVSSFFEKVSEPVLSDLAIDFGDADVIDVYPRELPDLFNGSQVVVFGRYKGGLDTPIRLAGRVEDDKREFIYEASFARRNRSNGYLPRLWASRKIAYLMEEIRSKGEHSELVDAVVDLAMEHGIVTPYTSYLIMEDEELSQRGGRTRVFSDHMALKPKTVDALRSLGYVGEGAVDLSQRVAKEKKSSVISKDDASQVRHAAGKTFYHGDDGWVDSAYHEGDDVKKIEFLSKDYFKLLDKAPDIGKYLALGDNVLFVFEGEAYKITVSTK